MATALSDSGVNPLVLPPAVAYPLAPPRSLRLFLLAVWGVAMVIHVYWLVVSPAGDWRPWAGGLAAAVAAGLAWRAGPLAQSGVLVWDGSAWCWEQAARSVAGRIVVRLDAQSVVLLRFVSDAGSNQWFWLDRNCSPGHWLALRRAVHGPVGSPVAAARAGRNRAVTP